MAKKNQIEALPQNIEAEQAVLGAILIESGVFNQLGEILTPKDFYKDAHKIIFTAMIDLNKDNIPIDLLTLYDHLKSRGNLLKEVGESSYLTYLTELVPAVENVNNYANLVLQTAKERNLCKIIMSVDHGLRTRSINYTEAVEKIENILSENISVRESILQFSSWSEIVGAEEKDVEFLIEDLIPEGCLLILAGKPKLGKSLLVLLFAIFIGLGESIWNKKVKKGAVLFISTEDGEIRLKNRIWKMLGSPDKHQPDFHFHVGDCILTDFRVLEALKTKIIEIKPSFVVLDPLINLFRGRDLNSGEDMNTVLRPLQNICKQTGTTILVIHHARKSAGEDATDIIQGSTTISGVADGVMILKNHRGAEEKLATLEVILKDTEIAKTSVLRLGENLRWGIEGELEEVSGRSVGDEVIKALVEDTELTIQNLIQITGYDYRTLYRCLLKMEDQQKVTFEKRGRSHIKVYSLKSEIKTKMENETQRVSSFKYSEYYDADTSFSKRSNYGKPNGNLENENLEQSEDI